MTPIVNKLTTVMGSPLIRVKQKIGIDGYTVYQWTFGDTKVLLIDKGEKLPVWLNISSVSVKNTIVSTSEIDLEKILFGDL